MGLLLEPTRHVQPPRTRKALPLSAEPDEPRRHPLYMLLVVLCALGTAPFLFIGSEPIYVLGLPVWLWSSIGFTLALSLLTAWGVLRYWRDDPPAPGGADDDASGPTP